MQQEYAARATEKEVDSSQQTRASWVVEIQKSCSWILGGFDLNADDAVESCGPPACGICLCEITLMESAQQLCSCDATFCKDCLEQYFSGIVKESRYSCPTMRCPAVDCRTPIPTSVWKDYVQEEVNQEYVKNASALFTIRCEDCDGQYSLFCSETDKLDEGEMLEEEIQNQVVAVIEQFQNREIPAATVVEVLSHLISKEGLVELMIRLDEPSPVLALVSDVERRTTLFLEYLRAQPFITTPCCQAPFCFRCKCMGHHEGETCDERAKEEIGDGLVQCCPACGVPTVRQEGCEHIICVCGQDWNWETCQACDDY
jgi:hypothetical protein